MIQVYHLTKLQITLINLAAQSLDDELAKPCCQSLLNFSLIFNVTINESMMEDLVIWIGIIAGILVMSSSIPQIIKSYKSKKMSDVSTYLLGLIASGLLLWVVYGFIKLDPVLIGTNAAGLSLNVTLLIMKLKYDKLQSSTIKTS